MKRLVGPLVGSAVLMAAYLTLRPYGDATTDPAQIAAAFADWRWIAAHVCGLLALAQFARMTQRLEDAGRDFGGLSGRPPRLTRWARTTGLVGAMLTLPYYGAETFGLHALGLARLTDANFPLLEVTDAVRNHPVALALFGVGLLSLAVSAVVVGLAWRKLGTRPWAAWPLAVFMIGFLPQFYLPVAGRVAYGALYAVSALIFAWAAWTDRSQDATSPDPGSHPLVCAAGRNSNLW